MYGKNIQVPNLLRVSEDSQTHCGITFKDDSLTDQSCLALAKINGILAKYKVTGLLDQKLRPAVPLEKQTAPELSDFQQCHNYVCELMHREDLMVSPHRNEAVAEGDSAEVKKATEVAEGVQPSPTEANPTSGEPT